MASGVLEQTPVPLPSLPGWPGDRDTYRRYDRDRVAFLRQSREKFGDTYRFGDDTLVTCDPDLIRSVLTRSNREFIAEEAVVGSTAEDAEVQAHIARWMTGRKVAGQTMRHVDPTSMTADLESELTAALAPALSSDPADTLSLMMRYASGAATRYCLGEDADAYHATAAETTRRAVKLMAMSRLLPGWLPVGPGSSWKRSEERSKRVMHEIVQARREQGGGTNTLLDVLLAAGLDSPTISATIRPTIGAAFGVPGTALTWGLIHLLERPDWQARIGAEFLAAPANTDISRAMPWASDYVREVLRLYAPTWLMARQVRADATLGPAQLPRGSRVMFSPLLVHTDPRWWTDPLTFDPDRWPTSTATSREYFPFGAGPRVCVGAILGTTHMVWALGYICAHYRLRAVGLDTRPMVQALYQPTMCRIEFTPSN